MQFIPLWSGPPPERLAVANADWGERVRDRPRYVQQGSLVTDHSVSPDGYGRFLIDVFEDWVRGDVGEVYVQMLDVALANWYRQRAGSTPPASATDTAHAAASLNSKHSAAMHSAAIHSSEPAA